MKKAHWIIIEYEYLTCSECGESHYTGAESTAEAKRRVKDGDCYQFCPWCGVEMVGKGE